MKAPLVSMVMPAHNAEATIAEAIASCLSQTMEEFELLVMLDGCTDRSAQIANGFADSRLRVFAHKDGPKGVAWASNELMERASAPLIARMDADDLSRPGRLKAQCNLLAHDESLHGVTGKVHLLNPQGDIARSTGRRITISFCACSRGICDSGRWTIWCSIGGTARRG